MALTVYQQADVGEPSFYIGDAARAGSYATIHLGGHDLRMQTREPDSLDALAVVLMEAAEALRRAQRQAGSS